MSRGTHIIDVVLDYIHSNCRGLSRVKGMRGYRYFVLCIDEKSRYTGLRLLKSKDKAFKAFKQWKDLVENQQDKKIKKLCTDIGLEICKEEFNQCCTNEGIGQHLTVRKTP